MRWFQDINLKMNLCLQICWKKFVTVVSLIQALIDKKHVIKYVITLNKAKLIERSVKAKQSMGKCLHKVFKTVAKCVCKVYQLWVNLV